MGQRLIGAWDADIMPDGAYQLAIGANRVARALAVSREHTYELHLTFTVPKDQVLDLTRIRLWEEDDGPV